MAKKRMTVALSTARSDLFRLADLVRQSRDGTIVVLESRGGGEPVALVRETRLAYLEDRVAQMEMQAAPSFTLGGSLSAPADDETLERTLRELRHAWAAPAAGRAPKAARTRSSAAKPKPSRRP